MCLNLQGNHRDERLSLGVGGAHLKSQHLRGKGRKIRSQPGVHEILSQTTTTITKMGVWDGEDNKLGKS